MCSTLNPICDIGTIVGSVGGQVAGSVFDQVSRSFGDAASKVTGWMWTVIGSATAVTIALTFLLPMLRRPGTAGPGGP